MARQLGRVGAKIVALAVLATLACSTPVDTARRRDFHPEKGPRHGCYIYCSEGRKPIFQRQHLCPGGTRWFADIWITGETKDSYLTDEGAYSKLDVELVPCDIYIRQIIDSRDPAKRGRDPGTDELGNPDPSYNPRNPPPKL